LEVRERVVRNLQTLVWRCGRVCRFSCSVPARLEIRERFQVL